MNTEPTKKPRILHIIHTLPVEVVLLPSATPDPLRARASSSATLNPPRRLSRLSASPTPPAGSPAASPATVRVPGPPLSTAAAAPGADSTEPRRWKLVPRQGHRALYSGIESLCLLPSSPTEPAEPESETFDCAFIGSIGTIADADGRPIDAAALTPADRASLETLLWTERACIPVWLDDAATAAGHYEGYCKRVLWPLFHYIPWPGGVTDGRREAKDWAAYQRVNRAYAAVAAERYADGDLVWVHDYHLLLAPAMLREMLTSADETARADPSIALYVHTPFPSSEMFRKLPTRSEVLTGILGATIVGMQKYEYARHFISACTRILGVESTPTGIELDGRQISVATFPIGIDVAEADRCRARATVCAKVAALRTMYAGKRIIVGRDKMDQLPSVVMKLQAFERFLDRYPEWRDHVVLIQITAPAAGHLPRDPAAATTEVNSLERRIADHVARINGRFGSMSYTPVLHHFNRAVDQDDFYALLGCADVGLITSVRGLSTTCHEFVVAQQQLDDNDPTWSPAPLILSEFTSTAGSLSSALLVNPFSASMVAETLADALAMPRDERINRHRQLLALVRRYTAPRWARSVVDALRTVHAPHALAAARTTPALDRDACLAAFSGAAGRGTRLILLDYDGTLTPIVKLPELARPTPVLLDALTNLCADPANRVFVISGRDQATLEAWLGRIPRLGLSAEHGCFFKPAYGSGAGTWLDMTEALGDPSAWKAEVVDVFNYYTERTPGSFIEHKRSSVTWHYRLADPAFGAFMAKECQAHMENSLLAKRPLEIMVGKKNLEVRPSVVNKGEVVNRLLAAATDDAATAPAFVLCAGDDRTDEDMFRALRRAREEDGDALAAFSVTVGPATKRTVADWHLAAPQLVVDLLRDLAAASSQ
ncbi:hypothetical protein H9P43_002646 [Blastocladiella emersonii ATCC 22665]|nr:hypothetical protein H9P43_002646 [Blastocladiella emersonii ATCC 22665]